MLDYRHLCLKALRECRITETINELAIRVITEHVVMELKAKIEGSSSVRDTGVYMDVTWKLRS
jgi:hypothetical protein